MRRPMMLGLVLMSLLLVSGCGSDSQDGADTSAEGEQGQTIEVTMRDMEYEPETVEVAAGEPVTFELVNEGNSEHDLAFEGGPETRVAPGETGTLEVDGFEEDTVGWCTIPGHREAGMELQVEVQ